MKSTDLTPDHAHAIHRKLGPMVAYLTLLEERMEQRDFPRDDKLYRLVKRACDAVQDVFLETYAGHARDGAEAAVIDNSWAAAWQTSRPTVRPAAGETPIYAARRFKYAL